MAHMSGDAEDSKCRAESSDGSQDILQPLSSRPRHARETDFVDRRVAARRAEGGHVSSDAGSSAYNLDAAAETHAKRRFPLAAKVLIALLVVLGAAGAGLAVYMNDLDSTLSVDEGHRASLNEVLVSAQTKEKDRSFYTLIIGSDAREGLGGSRSDVIMLARVDPDNAQVALVSIPRDTIVQSVGGSAKKINAEYNLGAASVVSAVSQFAGVDISHYVEVSFDGLKDVVDALGGVEVDIPESFTTGGQRFEAGVQMLNGSQALVYARERYHVSGGDLSRAQAQRQIVEAIARKVLASSPLDLPGVVQTLAKAVSTDMTVGDIVSYALEFQGAEGDLELFSAVTPSYTYELDGVSYVATMYDEWKAMMQRVGAGLDPNDDAAEIPEEQAANERLGLAANAAGPRDYEGLAASAGLTTEGY